MGKWLSKGRLEEGAGDIERRVAMWEELRDRGVCDGTRVVLGGFSLGWCRYDVADGGSECVLT